MDTSRFLVLVVVMVLIVPHLGAKGRGQRVPSKRLNKVKSVSQESTRNYKKRQKSCGCLSKKVDPEISKKVDPEISKKYDAPSTIETISPQALREKMFGTRGKAAIAISVLPEDVFEKCHIKGSINVPLDDILEDAAKKQICELCESEEVVLYCFNDVMSSTASEALRQYGCNVSVCSGGLIEWISQELEIEGEWANKNRTEIVEELEKMKPLASE